jgi:hypothetical protein
MAFRTCLRYIHSLRRLDHVSHLETSVMGALLADYARIQLLSFLYKVLHVRHPCYLFSLFRFASSARTRNLVIPAHRSLITWKGKVSKFREKPTNGFYKVYYQQQTARRTTNWPSFFVLIHNSSRNFNNIGYYVNVKLKINWVHIIIFNFSQ